MGKNGKVQTALEYAAVRGVLTGLGWLPRPIAVATARGIGRLAYSLGGRLRHTGERNIEIAFPNLTEHERAAILRGCFKSLGRLLGEFSQFPHATPESLRRIIEFEGLENLQAAVADGRGVIVFTAHLGAWELLSFALSAFGYPMSFLVRRIDNSQVEQLVEKTRTRFGNLSIDKRAAARPVMRVLRQGGIVGILIDLNTQQHEGVFVDFFGIPASTTTSLAKLALRTDAAVIPFCMPWDEHRQRFLMRIDPPLEITRTGNKDQDVHRLTSLFTSVIESYVRLYPDQWLWIHKRWNTRPAGEKEIYR
ncbi:MAG TPA: lysophospholipid acyltransferase family protein [Pyrinomonadaceae bacterium]|jgi:KDO2-lipid IV(A) lauroyltransferase